MKALDALPFDTAQYAKETAELANFLSTKPVLRERQDILPFFRKRPHLAALCGHYNPAVARFDRIAWEYDLFGDFSCDLVVGDSVRKTYSFIEFEDAGPRSLFVRVGKKASREWSPRLGHGYGQIIDWICKLDDRRKSDEYEARFGKRAIEYWGVLVIGRDQYMSAGERLRLEWRRENVVVHSKKIKCVTFDELVTDLQSRLAVMTQADATGS